MSTTTPPKQVLNETYSVFRCDNDPEAFQLHISDIDSQLLDCVFQINSIKVEENEDKTELFMNIDYDLITPENLPEPFESLEDPIIIQTLGDIITDILERAIKESKLHLPEEETNDSNTKADSE